MSKIVQSLRNHSYRCGYLEAELRAEADALARMIRHIDLLNNVHTLWARGILDQRLNSIREVLAQCSQADDLGLSLERAPL